MSNEIKFLEKEVSFWKRKFLLLYGYVFSSEGDFAGDYNGAQSRDSSEQMVSRALDRGYKPSGYSSKVSEQMWVDPNGNRIKKSDMIKLMEGP